MGMAERLKRARLEAGLSQKKLAHMIQGTETSIIRYEAGQARPRPFRLKAIAEITDKPISYFLDDDFSVPTTLETFKSPSHAYSLKGETEPLLVRQEDAGYLTRLGNQLNRIEEELRKLTLKLNAVTKKPLKSSKPAGKSRI